MRHYLFRLLQSVPAVFLLLAIGCQTAPYDGYGKQNSRLASTTPVPRSKEFTWMSLSTWYNMHAEDVDLARQGDAELVILGDSIMESWTWGGDRAEVFRKNFSAYKTANFAVGGDMTQNLLWRLQHGLKGQLDPAAIVLMIGVNNFLHEHHSPREVAAGIKTVLKQVRSNYPDSKILIFGVLPYDEKADSPSREEVTATNRQIAEYADGKHVFFIDVGSRFLDKDGNIPKSLMADFLHPTAQGLEIIAPVIIKTVAPWITDYRTRKNKIKAADKRISIMGRTVQQDDGSLLFGYPGVTLTMRIKATAMTMQAKSAFGNSYIDVTIDEQPAKAMKLPDQLSTIELFSADQPETHTVIIQNRSETWQGPVTIKQLILDHGNLLPAPALPERKITIIGDSITCGAYIDRPTPMTPELCSKENSWWNARQTYGMRLGKMFNAQVQLVCYGGRGLVRTWDGKTDDLNAPEFYELAMPEIERKYSWDQRQYHPDLVIIALGTNDFSESAGPSFPDRDRYIKTYIAFIKRIQAEHPGVRVIITDGPMLGNEAKSTLRSYLDEVAASNKLNNVSVMPAKQYLGDSCDAHPTRDQHKSMADDFKEPIKRVMNW